jgi:hypothetical protein
MIRINTHPSRRQLRQFGLIWLIFFGAIGAWTWYRGGAAGLVAALAGLAVIVPVVGWMVPKFMRIVYLAMSYAAWPIGFVVSHVILAIVYYLVITPIGLFNRLRGYDPMHRRFDPAAETYWIPRQPVTDIARYYRQF